jgi:hypothetical protein
LRLQATSRRATGRLPTLRRRQAALRLRRSLLRVSPRPRRLHYRLHSRRRRGRLRALHRLRDQLDRLHELLLGGHLRTLRLHKFLDKRFETRSALLTVQCFKERTVLVAEKSGRREWKSMERVVHPNPAVVESHLAADRAGLRSVREHLLVLCNFFGFFAKKLRC